MKPTSLLTKLRSRTSVDPLLRNTIGLPEGEEGTHEAPDPAESQPGAPDQETAVITGTHDSALAFGKELIYALSADLRQGDLSRLEAVWEQFRYQVSVVNVANVALQRSAAAALPSPQYDPDVAEYLISSRFLTQCATYLLADPNGFERLHLVTGIALGGNRYTLDQMQKVAMSAQSRDGAQADQQALTRALVDLSESGHALHGLFHSHPGFGPRATLPSPDKDIPTHQRFETGDYPLIGAIFVPGHVRFFTANQPFTVRIYGTGVTLVPGETDVYHIQTSARRVSYETIAGR